MNIINAIANVVNNTHVNLLAVYSGNNRANNVGDALEEYVKDLFSDSFDLSETERLEKWNEIFSYTGNSNNPPDIMLKNGDAIEVKKIESKGTDIALNSSHPKHTLKATSSLINQACKNCEEWDEKDILYIIGYVKNNKLKALYMVYGLDYCASEECYLNLKNRIKNAVEEIPCIDFSRTKEIGHVNKVDPLGITYLRIRNMWGIQHPSKVFNYIYEYDDTREFSLFALINEEKWNTFDNTELITSIEQEGFDIQDVRIKNPDNPVQLRNAKLITYEI